MLLAEAKLLINKLAYEELSIPVCKNKGVVGLYLETKIGLTNNGNHLDCDDGEIKTFPLKRLKSGGYSPKESIALTMINRTLENVSFGDSGVKSKINHVLFVPYLRENDFVTYFPCVQFDINNDIELRNELFNDYNLIQQHYIQGDLASRHGKYIQARTKGSRGSSTRAFYFRTIFIKRYIINHIRYS